MLAVMRALCLHRYGGPEVLAVADLPDPLPGRGQVRVRVHAASVNPKDVLVRKGKFKLFTGERFPLVPGYDVAGVVDHVGAGAFSFQRGEEVWGMIQRWAGGACAEYAIVPVDELDRKPAGLSMAQAASLPLVALTALQALRDVARIQPGERLLINGASGGVGTAAVQIASAALGAHTTAICSQRNRALVASLGAHAVLPYDLEPLGGRAAQSRPAEHRPGRRQFDVIFDVFGNLRFEDARAYLAAGGRYVTTVPSREALARDVLGRAVGAASRLMPGAGPRRARLVVVKSRARDLAILRGWVERGLLRPVVDRAWPLAEARAAHEYLETKRARGKVVLAVVASEPNQ
ncbi:MAG: NAD(P)-dependent alcohol dehydrogenase [Haliangiales bacterium]